MLYDYFKQRKIGLFSRFVLGMNIYRNIPPDIDPPGSILMYFSILIQSVTSFFASAMI